MGKAVGLGVDRDVLGALAAGDLGRVLEHCGERLLTTVWGCGPTPTLVPRTGLVAWFRGRDALTDKGVRIHPVATIDASIDTAGPTVALLRHSLERTGHQHAYETVDRWAFQAGRLVAWFSRPVDPAQYALAWGVPYRNTGNRAAHTLGRPHVVDGSWLSSWPTVTGAKGPSAAADDDSGTVRDGRSRP